MVVDHISAVITGRAAGAGPENLKIVLRRVSNIEIPGLVLRTIPE